MYLRYICRKTCPLRECTQKHKKRSTDVCTVVFDVFCFSRILGQPAPRHKRAKRGRSLGKLLNYD